MADPRINQDRDLAGSGRENDDGIEQASGEPRSFDRDLFGDYQTAPSGEPVAGVDEDALRADDADAEGTDERLFSDAGAEDPDNSIRHARGSGASADDIEDECDPRQERLLDEGVEETFPASDPVSVKRIT